MGMSPKKCGKRQQEEDSGVPPERKRGKQGKQLADKEEEPEVLITGEHGVDKKLPLEVAEKALFETLHC